MPTLKQPDTFEILFNTLYSKASGDCIILPWCLHADDGSGKKI